MFMWPHHMQQEDRYRAERLRLGHRWNVHHNWGLRALEWDADAFQSGQFEITTLQARMRDGTIVDVPGECRLPTLDLKELMIGKDQIRVYLAIAIWNPSGPNAASDSEASNDSAEGSEPITTRFRVEQFDVADENDGADPKPLAFRTLNLKLLVDVPDQTGYEVLEIAQFKKASNDDDTPQIDELYIPPILACDAWKPLAEQIMQMLYHHLTSRMDKLAAKAQTRGITFETQNPGDNKLLGRLAVLNEATAVLNTLAFARGVHPFTAYLELCRLVGQLAIFRDNYRSPKLPRYDHDDLGGCFYRVRCFLEEDNDSVAYEERDFIGAGLRMQVTMEPTWLESAFQLFVGVRSPLAAARVIDLLTTPGELDMKIGSGDRVDQMFMRGIEGLEFTLATQPPRVLPVMSDLTYFQVSRDSQQAEWAHVQESLALAIRVNDTRLAIGPSKNLDGERTLSLKAIDGHAATTMQFSLFVVPGESAAS